MLFFRAGKRDGGDWKFRAGKRGGEMEEDEDLLDEDEQQ